MCALQKCVAAIRILVYDFLVDAMDEYVHIRLGSPSPVTLLIISMWPSSTPSVSSTSGLQLLMTSLASLR
jgi:hypothetical protein